MAKQIQKDRYIHLDGTPVEAKGLWRHVSPLCLAATFATAALCSNYFDHFPHVDKKDTPATPIVEAMLGLVGARIFKEFMRYSYGRSSYDRSAYDKYVIDTKSDRNAMPINPKDEEYIKINLEVVGYPVGGYESYIIAAYGLSDAINGLPILHDCITHVHRLHKLNKGDWVIIDRNDMKKVEEEQKQENHTHAHSHAPAV